MNVGTITPVTGYSPNSSQYQAMIIPPNGNPGIIPPWLTKINTPEVVGSKPVGPNIPTIM